MSKHVAIISAIFIFSLIGMAVPLPTVSAQTGPSPEANPSGGASSCAENWTCSEWGNCSSGVSSRLCTDNGRCGTELSKPPENQSCLALTGIVRLTIIRPPEICGDKRCSENETCGTCPEDCGRCSVKFDLTGLMAGAANPNISGLVIIAVAILVIYLSFASRKRGVNDSG